MLSTVRRALAQTDDQIDSMAPAMDGALSSIDQTDRFERKSVMHPSTSKAPRRLLLVGAALAVVAAFVGSGVATATPAGPAGGLTAVVLADGTTMNEVNFNSDPIKLRTKDQLEVLQVSQTAISGWTSGWHEHTGAVFVNITAGSLTFYDSSCNVTTVTAGHGYIESPYDPILARNEGSVQAAWITTQIIPSGASRRIDQPDPLCGVQ
ncbi:MAG TPA: hypothetical protein VGQ58_00615 [Candidatus Limnocylindrales bacterium]|nr:hypothetical protein [Candidatus Limnocylindrales bacterium]